MDNKSLFMSPSVNQYGSHMVMSNVCKETKIKYLNLDTIYCDESYLYENNNGNVSTSGIINSSSSANYNFTLPEKITDVKSIHLENIQFPLIQTDNISSQLGNNYFKLTFYPTVIPEAVNPNNSQTKMIIIPDGVYTKASLITKINSIMNTYLSNIGGSNDGTKTLNLYFNTNKDDTNYIYTDSYTYYTYVINFAVDINGNFDRYNFKSKLGWLLGFRQPSYKVYNYDYKNTVANAGSGSSSTNIINNIKDKSPNATLIADDLSEIIPQLIGKSVITFSEKKQSFPLGSKYYYLVIDEFSTNFQNSFTSVLPYSLINKYIIGKINLNHTNLKAYANYTTPDAFLIASPVQGLARGDVMYYPANNTNGYLSSSKRNYNGKVDIQKINVKVIDEKGNTVDMQEQDFSFCLKIEYE